MACRDGELSASNFTVTNTLPGLRTVELYVNDVLSSTEDETTAYAAVYANNCVASFTDGTISDTVTTALAADGGTYELSSLTFDRVGSDSTRLSPGILFQSLTEPITATITDVTITDNQQSAAISLHFTRSAIAPGQR